jgi:hypothetical protein
MLRATAASALLGACAEEVKPPPPPNMRALIEAYTQPTAPLTTEDLPQVYASLSKTFVWFNLLCGWDEQVLTDTCDVADCHVCQGLSPMTGTFSSLSDSNNSDSRELSRKIAGISGYLNVTRICPGYGEEQTRDPENGELKLVVGFTSRGIDPTFGGTLEACKTRVDGQPTTLNGNLDFAFGRSFFLDELSQLEPIVRFRGTIETPISEQSFTANARLSAVGGGDIAVNFDVADAGTMLYYNGTNGQGFQAENGRFSCTFDGPVGNPLRCQNVDTGEKVP